MKSISRWAHRHKWPARILVIICFLTLYTLGYITGKLLNQLEVTLTIVFLFTTAGFYFIFQLLYPYKSSREGSATNSYYRRKRLDLLMALSVFLFMVYLGNQPDQVFRGIPGISNPVYGSSLPVKDSNMRTYKTAEEFSATMKDEHGKLLKWKARKKLLKAQIKAINSSSMSEAGQIALILLSVIVALGVMAGFAALACGLACNDQGFLALLLLLGGGVLVGWLLVKVIRSITRKKRPAEPAPAN